MRLASNDDKYNPSKLFTRDNATYVCPHSNIFDPASTSATSKVAPCDLCIVSAQAKINGIWETPIPGMFSLGHI